MDTLISLRMVRIRKAYLISPLGYTSESKYFEDLTKVACEGVSYIVTGIEMRSVRQVIIITRR
jgi:hypothetical protein